MQKEKGYLLPDVALTEDMACTLVYYPNKPEYRRALGGSLAYLATWIAWEKESTHSGIDAALSWKIAYDLTMDCWNMACLEELQSNVAAILAIMEAGNQCCDEQDITDGDRYTDRVTDGVGDVPQNIIDAGYAEDSADWDGFDDYKCMISHVIVNQIDARLIEYAGILDDYGPYAGTLAAVAGVFAVIFSTAGLAIVFGMVMGVGAVAFLYENLLGFPLLDDIIEKVQDNHEELACAVYQGDGDEGSLIALYDKIDELFTIPEAVLLKSVNLGPTLKALYSGRYDQQDIAAELEAAGYDVGDFDCSCIEQVGEYLFTESWDVVDDWQGWQHGGGDQIVAGNPTYGPRVRYGGPTGYAELQGITLAAALGLSHVSNRKYGIWRISVDLKGPSPYDGIAKVGLRTNATGAPWYYSDFSVGETWDNKVILWEGEPREINYDGGFMVTISAASGGYLHCDNVRIDLDSWLE